MLKLHRIGMGDDVGGWTNFKGHTGMFFSPDALQSLNGMKGSDALVLRVFRAPLVLEVLDTVLVVSYHKLKILAFPIIAGVRQISFELLGFVEFRFDKPFHNAQDGRNIHVDLGRRDVFGFKNLVVKVWD